jgi:UDP-glucose 4-epimerase
MGGLGYIESHTVIQLIEKGIDVVIVDNLSNTSRDVLNQLTQLT